MTTTTTRYSAFYTAGAGWDIELDRTWHTWTIFDNEAGREVAEFRTWHDYGMQALKVAGWILTPDRDRDSWNAYRADDLTDAEYDVIYPARVR